MRIIKITEHKKEKLSDYAEKALKNMGKLMQCIEDLDEEDDDMGERMEDWEDDDMGERGGYGGNYGGGSRGGYGGGSMGERRRRSRRTGRFM
jgi:hypothetical protein